MNDTHLTRRSFLAGTAAALTAGCATTGQPRSAVRRPNIVYAFSDEHRYQSMSFTEMPEVHTATMAMMAGDGCSFRHCISNYPVCSPYRAILLTSRWPYQTGMIDNSLNLSPEETTVGKSFQAAGYRTGYIGKWHLGGERAEPFGFETSLIWTGINSHIKGTYHPADGAPVTVEGYTATLMTNQALDFMDTGDARPFFLMVSWIPPHSDFLTAPPEKKALYPEGSMPFRPNYVDTGEGTNVLDRNGSPYYEGYHAHISAIDDELARIIDHLKSRGLWENTILLYSSDHGSMQGSHGVGSKRQPYEESIGVPFLACGAGVKRGAAPTALFGAIDIMPTLCGLAGLDIPESCEGRDFSPWMRGVEGPSPEYQFIMHIQKSNASGGEGHPAPLFRGLRTPRYTYALDEHGKPMCLFDNLQDPYQMRNLCGDAALAALEAEFRATLKQALIEAEDPFVMPTA